MGLYDEINTYKNQVRKIEIVFNEDDYSIKTSKVSSLEIMQSCYSMLNIVRVESNIPMSEFIKILLAGMLLEFKESEAK